MISTRGEAISSQVALCSIAIRRAVHTILLLICLCSLTGTASAQTPVSIKLATLAPKSTSLHQILMTMGQKWRAASGGSVSLNVYTDGVMGAEAQVVRQMQVGALQAA